MSGTSLGDSGKKRRNERLEQESSTEPEVSKAEPEINENDNDSDNEQSSDDEEIVNVDFDYFNFKELDFHALKNLLRQLFDVDNVEFNLSYFAYKILENPEVGSAVKADGPESDPFAILTVLDITKSKKDTEMKALIEYFILKTQGSIEMNRKLRQILSPASTARVGLLLSERLLNMPIEIVPPLYNMLVSELEVANEKEKEKEKDKTTTNSYQFDYLILPSKTFYEEESLLDKDDSRPVKRNKKAKNTEEYLFHTEDELLHKEALYHTSYGFTNTNQESDSKRAFQDYGIFPQGHLMVLEGEKLGVIAEKLAKEYPLE